MCSDFGEFSYSQNPRRRNSIPLVAPEVFTDQLLRTMTFTFHIPSADEDNMKTRPTRPFGGGGSKRHQAATFGKPQNKVTQVVCDRRLATILENDPRNGNIDQQLMKSFVYLRDHGVQKSKRHLDRGRCYSAADVDDLDGEDGDSAAASEDDTQSKSLPLGRTLSGYRKQGVNSRSRTQRRVGIVQRPDHRLLDLQQSRDCDVDIDVFSEPENTTMAMPPIDRQVNNDRSDLLSVAPSFTSKGYISPNWSPILARKKIIQHSPTADDADAEPDKYRSNGTESGFGDTTGSSSLSESDDEVTVIEVHPTACEDTEDMEKLKELTNRLNLVTRRPSYVQWKEQFIDAPWASHWRSSVDIETQKRSRRSLDEGRLRNLDDNIDMLKKELTGMRQQDRSMAKQLIDVRRRIYQFKLERSCDEHQEMLDDVQDELEELVETDKISDLVEIPIDRVMAMPLRQHGITRMHISRRRFSVF